MPSETVGAKLRCELVTEFEQLEQLRPDWDRLWRADPAGEIYQTFSWARAWWRAYGNECSLHCLAVYDTETLIGLLPLVLRHGEIQVLGTPQADYADVVCEEERALDVLVTALSTLFASGLWKECKLQHLPAHSRLVRYWSRLPRRLRRYSRFVFRQQCPTIVVRPDCPDILHATASKKKMRKYASRLAKLGAINFRFIDEKVDAQGHLQVFFSQQIRRQRLIDKTSSCRLVTFRSLLHGLVEELDLKDQLRFSVLELNGVPIAYEFGFDVNGKYTMYQQTFDINLWDSSPGQALLQHMLQYASETRKREFDFTIGDEAYKKRYANCTKYNFTLYVEPGNIQGAVRWVRRTIQGFLYPRARAVRSFLQQYRIYDSVGSMLRRPAESDEKEPGRTHILLRDGVRSFLKRAFGSIYRAEDSVVLRFDDLHAGKRCLDGAEIEIIQARLSDFADLLIENPTYPGDFDTWKVRKSRGDKLLILREGGKTAITVWTTSDPKVIGLASHDQALDLDSSQIVYERWASPEANVSRSYAAVLSFLANEAKKQKQNLWISCTADTADQRKQLLRQGFEAKFRFQNWRIFGWIRFRRVTPVDTRNVFAAKA